MRNPKECFCLRQNQTFFVLNELTPATGEDGNEPLMFHHNTFSRFNFVIINEQNKAATANIPVNKIPGIFKTVQAKSFARFMSPPTTNEGLDSPAYTVHIGAGNLKGKTPAGALLENVSNKTLLENQVKWLTDNLQRYPKNQVQIDAINEALKLYERGQLRQSGFTSEQSIIYKTEMRPLIRRKRPNGKCFVYEITIIWHEGMEKPIEFEIKNYYAPVVQRENGLLNVMAKEREDEVKNHFSVSLEEWDWLEHMLNAEMATFEMLHSSNMYKKAYEAEMYNKTQAKK